MKSAIVAIIGRPSVGKSTLLNNICGQKVSIVDESPQTTRNKIRGIYTEERGQIVFVDTPGFHLSDKKINSYYTEAAVSSLGEVDAAVYMLDIQRKSGQEEQKLVELLKTTGIPVLPVVNKIDQSTAPEKYELPEIPPGWQEPFYISAKEGTGVSEFLTRLFTLLPEGELMYPAEYYTDQEPSFRISEIIREKAIRRVKQEIPHAIYVEIADMEQRGNDLWIRAFLVVERETQKAILIGNKAQTIKKIREGAQRELRKLFPQHIKLDLRVKVNKKWRSKDYLLKGMFRE
ncbi:MAG: GTPase Era [Spirochaetales bacterium]|nr:GTPase Era [Spirochaetales bacterium]